MNTDHDDHCHDNDNDGDSGSMDHDTEVVVAIEFRGDDFVFQQVRRVIGSVVVAEEYMNQSHPENNHRSAFKSKK
jgi:tRNA U38,U39,U40 pseudouridine synthase TruA